MTDEQTKDLWTFLGVALGAVVTLIGALLTEQHNRRTDALTRQTADREQVAREQEQRLARETEYRQKIDTMTKVLSLITVEGGDGYAPRARIAGAIATLMQLGGGVIGMRILGGLWEEEAIDSDTACWLMDRVLENSSSPTEAVEHAVNLLAVQADRLMSKPEDDQLFVTYWPDSIGDSWPAELTAKAKNALLIAVVRVLLARDIRWWQHRGDSVTPINILISALNDDVDWGGGAAAFLKVLCDAGAFDKLDYSMDPHMERIQKLSNSFILNQLGSNLLDQLRLWAAGEPNNAAVVISTSTVSQSTVMKSNPRDATEVTD